MSEIDGDIIALITCHKTELDNRFNVKSLSIFGSVSKGKARSDSDLDVLVHFRKTPGIFGFIDLKHFLEDITGRSVDLVTEKALKKQLRNDILREAIRVT